MSQDEVRIDVAELNPEQRRILEEITGHHLAGVRQVTIEIPSARTPPTGEGSAQRLEEWTSILDGLTDEKLDVFDRLLAARPNLTRNVP